MLPWKLLLFFFSYTYISARFLYETGAYENNYNILFVGFQLVL